MSNQNTTPAPTTITPDLAADYAISIVRDAVSNGRIPMHDIGNVLPQVYEAVLKLGQSATPVVEEKPPPPVPIRKTVTPDPIISLEDGRPYKTLKRHLAGRGLTPDQYRQKWGLPVDYPMVAANYAAQRSQLAKDSGLGASRRKAQAA